MSGAEPSKGQRREKSEKVMNQSFRIASWNVDSGRLNSRLHFLLFEALLPRLWQALVWYAHRHNDRQVSKLRWKEHFLGNWSLCRKTDIMTSPSALTLLGTL